MTIADRFGVVDPTELNTLTYIFDAGLDTGEVILVPTVLVTVVSGTDPTPQNIVNGTPQISSNSVLVSFTGQLPNVDYDVKVTVTTSNPKKILALAKILPCRTQ